MRIPEVVVRWTSRRTGLTKTLEGVQQISIRYGKDVSHNTCDITLNNTLCSGRKYVGDDGDILFATEDAIDVYVKFCDGTPIDTSAADDLIFSGRLVDFEVNLSDSKSPLKLQLSDSSYLALNRLWVGDESGTAPNLIVDQLIPWVNEGLIDSDIPIKADLVSNDGFVQDTPSVAGSYNTQSISKVFKPMYEVINELSAPGFTGDGTSEYRFYIDKENNFHWFYPGERDAAHVLKVGDSSAQPATDYTHPVTDEELTVTDSNRHYIIGSKLKKAVYDVTNFIIYKAGEDMNGNQILDFYFDPTTGTPTTKDSFRSWEEIARNMKEQDRRARNITKGEGDSYNYPVSYPITPAWGSSSVSTNDEYNDDFILEAKKRAEHSAVMETSLTGNPRYKGSIELIGENVFDPTEYLIFTSEYDGITKRFFIIDEVSHVINKSGWTTSLKVSEDVPKDIITEVS